MNWVWCSGQQKLKEEREAKRATLDNRHQHIFSTVATKLRMKESEIEDFILEGDQVGSVTTLLLALLRSIRFVAFIASCLFIVL